MSRVSPEKVLGYVEELFVKYGAEQIPENASDPGPDFGLRPPFLRNGTYYRAEAVVLEGKDVIIITATDIPAYARSGIMDNVGGFRADLPPEKIEKEIRFIFGIEPWPESYPDYT